MLEIILKSQMCVSSLHIANRSYYSKSSELTAVCHDVLSQLTTLSYKQRVTYRDLRLQAGLSSKCGHVGTLEAQFLPILLAFGH